MSVTELLSPLIAECRQRFADWSLMLIMKNVESDKNSQEEQQSLSLSVKDDDLDNFDIMNIERIEVPSSKNDRKVSALSGEVRSWRSTPSINIDKLRENLFQIQSPTNIINHWLSSVNLWQSNDHRSTLITIEFNESTTTVITDRYVLESIEIAIQMHLQCDKVSMKAVRLIVLPIAIDDNQLIIHCITKDDGKSLNLQFYDSTGLSLGQLSDVKVDNNAKLEVDNHDESENMKIKIREIISKYTNGVDIDDQTSFSSLSFDSITYASIDFALKTFFEGSSIPMTVPYGTAYGHQSIESLSNFLCQMPEDCKLVQKEGTLPESSDPALLARKNCEIPLTSAQQRLLFLAKLNDDCGGQMARFTLHLHFGLRYLDLKRFNHSFNRLVALQSVLRTIYSSTGQQVISLTEAYFKTEVQDNCIFESALALADVPMRLIISMVPQLNPPEQLHCTNANDSNDTIFWIHIVQHHIMSDGQSIKILARQLGQLYGGNCLSDDLIGYDHARFALQHHNECSLRRQPDIKLCSSSISSSENYWRKLIANSDFRSPPTDWSRTTLANYRGRMVETKLNDLECNSIGQLCKQFQITQFTFLLALHCMLIHKKYGITQYCVGVTISERNKQPKLMNVIGYLVDVLPVVVNIDPDMSVAALIDQIDQSLRSAIQNHIPFNELVDILGLEFPNDSLPLFQILLIMDDVDQNDQDYGVGFNQNFVSLKQDNNQIDDCNDTNFAKYDQLWYFVRSRNSFKICIEFNGALNNRITITKLLLDYRKLLIETNRKTNSTLRQLTLDGLGRHLNLYRLRSRNRIDYPRQPTMLGIFQNQLSDNSNRYGNCVIQHNCLHYSGRFMQVYSNYMSSMIAQRYIQSSGMSQRADCYGVLIAERSIELVLTVLALWKLGIAVIPVSIDWPRDRILDVISQLDWPMVIADSKLLSEQSLRSHCGHSLYFDIKQLCRNQNKANEFEWKQKSTQFDLAYLTYSSGSTGQPKGICTEFSGLNNLALNYCMRLGLTARSNVYQVVNPAFDIFFADLIEAFSNGGTLTLASERIPKPEEMSKITHAYLMPAYLSIIQRHEIDASILKQLEAVNFGGDIIEHRTLHDTLSNGVRLWQQYGLTEHSIYMTLKQIKIGDRPSFVGQPMHNINTAICLNGHISDIHEAGVCFSSGVGLCRGYFSDEQLNMKTFQSIDNPSNCHSVYTREEQLLSTDQRWLSTNDIMEFCNEFGDLRFYERQDSLVKINGIRVDLIEIVYHLCSLACIESAVVITQLHDHQTILNAFVVLKRTSNNDQTANKNLKRYLNDQLSSKLPTFMLPMRYIVIERLPMNANGKIDRKNLSKYLQNSNDRLMEERQTDVAVPQADVLDRREQSIMNEFYRVIDGSHPPCLDQSFFDVGGNSLKALMAIQQIEQLEPNLNLQLSDVFRLRIFRELLQFIRECDICDDHHQSSNMPCAVTDRNSVIGNNPTSTMIQYPWLTNDGIPLSFAQQRMIFLEQIGRQHSYTLQIRLMMHGHVSMKHLNLALNYLIRRHRALRTIFKFPGEDSGQQLILSLTESFVHVISDPCSHHEQFEIDRSAPISIIMKPINDGKQLSIAIHHIIVDGRSLAILAEQFGLLYQQIGMNEFPNDSQSAEQLANTICQQQLQLNDDDEAYLCKIHEQLRSAKCLRIGWDYNEKSMNQETNSEVFTMSLTHQKGRLAQFCADNHCSTFTVLLTTFAIQMSQISGQTELAIVTPCANRNVQTMHSVGCFVNSLILILRTKFDNIADLLDAMNDTISDSLEHQHIPYEMFIERLNPERNSLADQYFHVSFALHNFSAVDFPVISGIEIEVSERDGLSAKYEQAWSFTEHTTHIQLNIEYASSLYKRENVQKQAEMFDRLLKIMIERKSTIAQYHQDTLLQCDQIKHSESNNKEIEIKKELKSERERCIVNDSMSFIEHRILMIWMKVLNNQNITIDDNFFAVGGNSLLIARICSQIEQCFQCECKPIALFNNQTIRQLATFIRESNRESSPNLLSVNDHSTVTEIQQIDHLPANELQLSMLNLYRNNSTDLQRLSAYQLGFNVKLPHSLNDRSLKVALNTVIVRHQALRTMFIMHRNQLYQCIQSATQSYFALQSRRYDEVNNEINVPNPFVSIPMIAVINTLTNYSNKCGNLITCNGENQSPGTDILTVHVSHVICDGHSLKLMVDELVSLIENRNTSLLPKVIRTYPKFSVDHNKCLALKSAENAQFWKLRVSQFGCQYGGLELDKIRPIEPEYRAGTVGRRFKHLHKLVESLTRKHQCSRFAVMLAAFGHVISGRVWETTKLIFSCAVDMRSAQDANTIGHYINVLPILMETRGECSVDEASECLKQTLLHSEITQNQLDDIFNGNTEPYRVMIVDESHIVTDALPSSQCEVIDDDSLYTKCDLCLFVSTSNRGIKAKIEYNSTLFYRQSIQLMLQQWAQAIYQMNSDTIRHHPILKPIDDKTVDFAAISYPQMMQSAFDMPNSVNDHLAFLSDKQQLTFAELRDQLARLAYMIVQLSMQITGETLNADCLIPVVGIGKSMKSLILCLSVIQAGAAYLPIDCSNPIDRIKEIIDQSGSKIYLSETDFMLDGTAWISIDRIIIIATSQSELTPKRSSKRLRSHFNDLAYTIFTSGSTGRPKGATIGQLGLMNMACASTIQFMMCTTDCVYQFTNFAFDNSVLEYTMALANNCKLYIDDDNRWSGVFDVKRFAALIKRYGITHALLFPGLVLTFDSSELQALAELRYWIVGAEKLPQKLLDTAIDCRIQIIQNYGPTETTAFALCRSMRRLDMANNIGQPIMNANIQIRHCIDSNRSLDAFSVGELYISSVGEMRGYITKSESFTEQAAQKAYSTGDIVKGLPNNDVLFLKRKDQQVKIRGFRVELSEIEAVLCKHSTIQTVKLCTKNGQLIAFVVLESNASSNVGDLRDHLAKYLPYYMIPAQLHFVERLPLTNNSKVDISALDHLVSESSISHQIHESRLTYPNSVLEFQLWRLFRKILGQTEVSITNDFFAIGGNSFLVNRLADAIIAEQMLPSIAINDVHQIIFQQRTIKQLAKQINILNENVVECNIRETTETTDNSEMIHDELQSIDLDINDVPLSYQQEQMRFLLETTDAPFYQLIFVQQFDAKIIRANLRLAFLRLIIRQHCLRSIFPEVNFEAKQTFCSGTECYYYLQSFDSRFIKQASINGSDDCHEDDRRSINDYILAKIHELNDIRLCMQTDCPILCADCPTTNQVTIVLRISHMVSDAWSTQMIERELSTLYENLQLNGKFGDSPLKFSYASFTVSQRAMNQELISLANEYARQIVATDCFRFIISSVIIDNDCQESLNDTINDQSSVIRCQPSETHFNHTMCEYAIIDSSVGQLCQKYQCTAFVALLGAHLIAFHALFNSQKLIVITPTANRNSQTDQIIGNFLNNLLISSQIDHVLQPDTDDDQYIADFMTRLNATVNYIRRYDSIPYILLIQCIERLMIETSESVIDTQIFEQIFFNFRYELESNIDNRLSSNQSAEELLPSKCLRKLEVDIDLRDSYYRCRLKLHSDIGDKSKCEALRNFILRVLTRMCTNDVKMLNSECLMVKKRHDDDGTLSIDDDEDRMEEKLRRIWIDCLAHEISTELADFFVEGGNSILLLKLKRMISVKLNVDLEIGELVRNRDFHSMLKLIKLVRCCKTSAICDSTSHTPIQSTLNLKSNQSGQRSFNLNAVVSFTDKDNNNPCDKLFVLFHALVGGIALAYGPLVQQLQLQYPDWHIMGVEHPGSFSSGFNSLFGSLQSLCKFYAQQIIDCNISDVKCCVFIGASIGGMIAYQTAQELFLKGIQVAHIISVDGISQVDQHPVLSYEDHCTQIESIIARKQTEGSQMIDEATRLAMLHNSWTLLQMAYRHVPHCNSAHRVSLLKAKFLSDNAHSHKAIDNDDNNDNDYGWGKLCPTDLYEMFTDHGAMLDQSFVRSLIDLIDNVIQKHNLL